MRSVVLLVLALCVSCSEKTAKPEPGDSVTGGDPVVEVTPPAHTKVTAGSGEALSESYKARVRVGGPVPAGTAAGVDQRVHGSTPASP